MELKRTETIFQQGMLDRPKQQLFGVHPLDRQCKCSALPQICQSREFFDVNRTDAFYNESSL